MKLYPDWLECEQTQKLIKAFGDDADKLRFVGGAVRDSLLERDVEDIDAATILKPQAVMELLEKSAIRTIPTGIKHGTITALVDGKHFEITTLRRDIACDGRHAEVVFTDNWQQDAARRDFTMNALYLSTSGELFDYFGGIEDTRAGRICFIGDARARIQEDYLRILRFFRFFAYYGNGLPDKIALAACAEFAPEITTLSGERIQHEMLKLLAALAPFSTLRLMQNSGVLEQVCGFYCHPALVTGSGAANSVTGCVPRPRNKCGVTVAWLIFSADISPSDALEILVKKWRLSNDFKQYLSTLIININNISSDIPLARQKHLIRTLGKDIFSSLLLLKMALHPTENYSAMEELAINWQIPIMPINGKDLILLGIPEGKKLGEKLHSLEVVWEASDYTLTKKELKNYLIS